MKRIRVRPGRAQSAFGFAVGCVFVLIGIFMAIPVFGIFGIFWTLVAVAITGMNAYHLFSDKGLVSHEIEIDGDSSGGDVEARLEKLRGLYERRVITAEEYEAQRAQIISKL